MNVEPGQVICLMGKEGSGNSGILITMLEETYIKSGECQMLGTYAYINLRNNFFLENSTLRENIILDEPFVRKRYEEVLKICDLRLSKFTGHDQVEVIENARNFSIIEQKKIILARFLYSERDIYLFDFYFDDIDIKKDKDHFDNVVNHFLYGKTVIYISNKEGIVS